MSALKYPRPLIDPDTPAHLVEAEIYRKFDLMEQSHSTLKKLLAETVPEVRRSLYDQFLQINNDLGIPTESAEQLLGAAAPALHVAGTAQEGGAA